MAHKAGFVNIIGRPNVGKSTLMNQLVGEKLSIITSKAQTTRHRIMGMVNDEDSQVVFSDTPGIIFQPQYGLHEAMMQAVQTAFEDADLVLFITDIYEKPEELEDVMTKLKMLDVPKFLLINKIDQASPERLAAVKESWEALGVFDETFEISALLGANLIGLMDAVKATLPEHPAYFDKEELTDRTERFFVSEIIREKILLNYQKEIPYSTEIGIEEFKDKEDITVIRALIFVERESQKNIIIGKGGTALKKVGMEARKDMEEFLGRRVFLELHVKVREGWRNDQKTLKRFGYGGN